MKTIFDTCEPQFEMLDGGGLVFLPLRFFSTPYSVKGLKMLLNRLLENLPMFYIRRL